MTGSDADKIAQLPDTNGLTNKFLIHDAHRNSFDRSVALAGGRLVSVRADADELERAIGDGVAGVYWTAGRFIRGECLPLARVSEIAHSMKVPVIVDAAAQVPPPENLSRFIEEGADLVAFSGGKAIRGPQSTGLILGDHELVEACRLNDNPHNAIGRPMKASKEDIVGLVKAVELYVAKDHAAEMAQWERRVACIIEALSDLSYVHVERTVAYGIAQQGPVAAISWDEDALGLGYDELVRRLLEGEPGIAVRVRETGGRSRFDAFTRREIRVYPDNLQDGEEVIVARRLREILSGSR